MKKILLTTAIIAFAILSTWSQDDQELIGQWSLNIQKDGTTLPSWLEVYKSGHATLVGRFVYAFGSARPVSEVKAVGNTFSFSIPRQWEAEGVDMSFSGTLEGGKITGQMVYTDAKVYPFTGSRTEKVAYNSNPEWGSPIALFNGKNLDGWHANGTNQWKVENGLLVNPKSGSNLISDQKFENFRLLVEFRYPEGSNSGIYLRGRHEVQIQDDYGKSPSSTLFGGIYGFITPNQMAANPAGEWQSYDITLNGDIVTVIANGKSIITDQIIPGITGGALDSNEGTAGPIFIQGDHGPVEFRKVELTPIK